MEQDGADERRAKETGKRKNGCKINIKNPNLMSNYQKGLYEFKWKISVITSRKKNVIRIKIFHLLL
jgi:hypothetical protein